jgi:hypothetical protein
MRRVTRIATEIEIAPAADRGWGVPTDFAACPDWNPFIRSISGPREPGARLSVTLLPPGARAMSFRPRLRVFRGRSELRWKGRLLLPGVFGDEHHFRISPPGPGSALFTHGEAFTGLLVPPVFRGVMRRRTQRGFVAMNQALKRRAERVT